MKLLFVLIFLLIPKIVNAEINNWIIGAYGVSAFIDHGLTQYGLGKGTVHEANYFQKWATDRGPLVAGISKGAEHATVIYFLLKYKKDHKKLVLFTGIGLTVFQSTVDYLNYKKIKNGS